MLSAAERLFRDQGFGATTVRQIATDAAVSTGTVMSVGDKDALLVAIFDSWIDAVHRARTDDQDETVAPLPAGTKASRAASTAAGTAADAASVAGSPVTPTPRAPRTPSTPGGPKAPWSVRCRCRVADRGRWSRTCTCWRRHSTAGTWPPRPARTAAGTRMLSRPSISAGTAGSPTRSGPRPGCSARPGPSPRELPPSTRSPPTSVAPSETALARQRHQRTAPNCLTGHSSKAVARRSRSARSAGRRWGGMASTMRFSMP
ncbi:TetR family transcriptional regulator [Streptomyces noursei]|nr:TetR family transcriptional regulator [Streptomyces noursei]